MLDRGGRERQDTSQSSYIDGPSSVASGRSGLDRSHDDLEEPVNRKALKVIARVKDKLTGGDFYSV